MNTSSQAMSYVQFGKIIPKSERYYSEICPEQFSKSWDVRSQDASPVASAQADIKGQTYKVDSMFDWPDGVGCKIGGRCPSGFDYLITRFTSDDGQTKRYVVMDKMQESKDSPHQSSVKVFNASGEQLSNKVTQDFIADAESLKETSREATELLHTRLVKRFKQIAHAEGVQNIINAALINIGDVETSEKTIEYLSASNLGHHYSKLMGAIDRIWLVLQKLQISKDGEQAKAFKEVLPTHYELLYTD
jgi:hypothetical protein